MGFSWELVGEWHIGLWHPPWQVSLSLCNLLMSTNIILELHKSTWQITTDNLRTLSHEEMSGASFLGST